MRNQLLLSIFAGLGLTAGQAQAQSAGIISFQGEGISAHANGVPSSFLDGSIENFQPYIAGGVSAALPGTVTFDAGPEDLSAGFGFNATLGADMLQTPMGVLGAQIHILHTTQQFPAYPGEFMGATSFMFRGTLTQPVTDTIDLYGALGLGGIFLNEDYSTGGTGFGLGYQAGLGFNVKVAPNISIGLEGTYQNTFSPIDASNGYPVQMGTTALTTSIRFDLPTMGGLQEIPNLDASGNIYGFASDHKFVGADGRPISIDIYGGIALPTAVDFTSPEPTNTGGAGGIAVDIPYGFFDLGVDGMVTQKTFSSSPDSAIRTTSLMGTAQASMPLTGGIDLSGGLGFGVMFLQELYSGGGDGFGLGYKAEVGLEHEVAPMAAKLGIKAFYQNSFGPIRASNGYDVQSPDFGIMGSVKFALPGGWPGR